MRAGLSHITYEKVMRTFYATNTHLVYTRAVNIICINVCRHSKLEEYVCQRLIQVLLIYSNVLGIFFSNRLIVTGPLDGPVSSMDSNFSDFTNISHPRGYYLVS